MLKRTIFVAKAERIDTAQLEMEFAEKLRQLDALAGTLPKHDGDDKAEDTTPAAPGSSDEPKGKSTGRRNLKNLPLEEERIGLAARGTPTRTSGLEILPHCPDPPLPRAVYQTFPSASTAHSWLGPMIVPLNELADA
jgi:hypothetical protein